MTMLRFGSVNPNLPTATGNLNGVAGFAKAYLDRVAEENYVPGTKELQETYPIFRNHLKDLAPFAKVWLLKQIGIEIEFDDLKQFKFSDTDRYMLSKFTHQLGGLGFMNVNLMNGMPTALTGADLIIAKNIMSWTTTREEDGRLQGYKEEIEMSQKKYELLKPIATQLKAGGKPNNPDFFYSAVKECRESGWFDLPEPSTDEVAHNSYVIISEETPANAAYNLSLNDIEQMVGGMANAAGFSFTKILDFLGSKFAPVRGGLIGGAIDIVGSLVKSFVLTDNDKTTQVLQSIPVIGIDKTVDKVAAIGFLTKKILAAIDTMKESDSDKRAEIIDSTCDEIKAHKELFESEEFLEFIRKIAEKYAKQEETAEAAPEQEPVENAAMAMSPEQAFPLLHKTETEDPEKPDFLNAAVSLIRPTKEKPGFIEEVNAVPTTPPAVKEEPRKIPMMINEDLLKDKPWLSDIAACARNNGISLKIDPVISNFGEGCSAVLSAITVVAYKDGHLIPSKSFTIDMGYCLDPRIKIFANCRSSGKFEYMETCNAAWRLFKENKIDTKFFNKLFLVGFEGMSEAEVTEYRMYNSNTMQLNRYIVYNTIPTGLCKKGEMRQGLKDSCFKMMTQLKALARINHIEIGRFCVIEFDKNSMSYLLDNAGGVYNGKPLNAPHMKIRVSLHMADGHILRDENKKPKFDYIIELVDNVIDDFKYPDGTLLTQVNPSADKEETYPDAIDVEVTDVEPDDNGEKPGFLTDSEQ